MALSAWLSEGVAAAAPADGRLALVRAAGVLRCGATARPGLASMGADHAWHGVLVELCRAVAVAVIGPEARVAFTGYLDRVAFARARGADDLAFLTGSEVFANDLVADVQPGPAVVFVQTGVMVAAESPARDLADLTDTTVCAESGTGAERALLAVMQMRGIGFRFSGWQEPEEMADAFIAGRCPAVAGETTALVAGLAGGGRAGGGRTGRLLEEGLGVTPVLATTALQDGRWSSTVAWVLSGVLSGVPSGSGGIGLAAGWQGRVAAEVGTYDAIVDRWLGAGSALHLAAGPNRLWHKGGLLAPPAVE